MVYVKWVFWLLFWAIIIGFLHYTLPQHDVMRITDTYERRIDPGDNSMFWANSDTGNDNQVANRDVFFIQTFDGDGDPMIYRNEDTGWGWPPYFKFDSANLQAEASDLISKKSATAPTWVVVRHYGWRNEFLSIFPNAVGLWEAEGPDQRIIPWVKIVILGALAMLVWSITARWRRFKRNKVAPKVDEWTEGWG